MLGNYSELTHGEDMQVVGNLAYVLGTVVGGNYGLQIIDVSDPLYPSLYGSFYSGMPRGVSIVGNLAYITLENAGLQIVNVSNPANPVSYGYLST